METKESKVNWKKMTFVLGFLFLVSVSFLALGFNDPLRPERDYNNNYGGICTQIKATPAWTQEGEIIGYGSGFPEMFARQSFEDVVNDYLIPNKINFIWDPKCIHCQNQIESFGDSWQDYQDSGLTTQCKLLG